MSPYYEDLDEGDKANYIRADRSTKFLPTN
jgi:hypothetical protein